MQVVLTSWKLDFDKRTALSRKCDTGSSIERSAVNTQMVQSLSIARNNENPNRTKRDKISLKAKNEDFLWF